MLNDGYIGCRIFVDLQKAFETTVAHNTLITKLDHFLDQLDAIYGTTNNWFKSYLSSHEQYVSINGFNSRLASISTGIPQIPVLRRLLSLLDINDLHYGINYCKFHHFAYDKNLLKFSKSIKHLTNINDLKDLVTWLNANKILP